VQKIIKKKIAGLELFVLNVRATFCALHWIRRVKPTGWVKCFDTGYFDTGYKLCSLLAH